MSSQPVSARLRSAVGFVAALGVAVSAAPPQAAYRTPRTESGQPDLRGVWNFSSDVPLERPAGVDKPYFTREEFEKHRTILDRGLATVAKLAPVEDVGLRLMDHVSKVEDLRTSLITEPADGRLPPLVDGARRVPGVAEILAALSDPKTPPPPSVLAVFAGGRPLNSAEDFDADPRCLPASSPPLLPALDGNYLQILQSAGTVALLTDASRRIVLMGDRPHVSPRLRSWLGDSRGHWEGDTLVVETTTFNNRTRSLEGAGTSAYKVLTERFTRQAANRLTYEATVVDPHTFTSRVVYSLPMTLTTGGRVYENACHEHNYSLANALSAARAAERAGASR